MYPFAITIIRFASHQMPAPAMKIEPRNFAHDGLLAPIVSPGVVSFQK
jgi:hypothetical protein